MPTIPADDLDYLKGWTAQDESSPPLPEGLAPQQFVDDQLPEQEEMDKLGLSIPENQLTDDVAALDPADQVRVGNADYASPLGVTANPEGAHIPGESAPPEDEKAAPELAAGATSGAPDDSWTKAEIQAYADEHGIEGVDQNSQNKADMLAAVNG